MRKNRMKAILAGGMMAACACSFMSGSSNASEKAFPCDKNVFINSIYSVGSNPYDYMVQVQNRTPAAIRVTITADGFGQHPHYWNMIYVSPQELKSGAAVTVKVGTGANGSLSAGNTAFYYDKPTNFRSPSVALNNCVATNSRD